MKSLFFDIYINSSYWSSSYPKSTVLLCANFIFHIYIFLFKKVCISQKSQKKVSFSTPWNLKKIFRFQKLCNIKSSTNLFLTNDIYSEPAVNVYWQQFKNHNLLRTEVLIITCIPFHCFTTPAVISLYHRKEHLPDTDILRS